MQLLYSFVTERDRVSSHLLLIHKRPSLSLVWSLNPRVLYQRCDSNEFLSFLCKMKRDGGGHDKKMWRKRTAESCFKWWWGRRADC